MTFDIWEMRRRFKRQLRRIAQLVTITEKEVLDFERVCGDVVCPICGLTYFDHVQLEDGPGKGLVLTCSGKLVKT